VSGDWSLHKVALGWGLVLLLLVQGEESLNRVMELLVQSSFLGWNGRNINVGVVNWALKSRNVRILECDKILTPKFN
jgi:hypothetical protein